MTKKKSNDHTDQNVPLLKSNTRLKRFTSIISKTSKKSRIKRKEVIKMRKVKMLFRIFELLLGAACIGLFIYEFLFFTLAPFFNGGHLPSLTYFGCGVNLVALIYLLSLESELANY